MRLPAHVAIVGCGFTGTSAFFQLVDRHPVERITIFEASGEFGPGYPYRLDECPDYLLNNTTDTLCLVPGNRRAFLNWLRSRPDYGPGIDGRGHLPRSVFGAFLKDVFRSTLTAAAIKGIGVDLVPHEATGMSEGADGRVRIGWSDGEVVADAALLTIGRCPDLDRYPHPPDGSSAVYVASHVRTQAFEAIGLDAAVHVLGSSLSAYDVVNRLFSPDTGCRFAEDADGALTFVPGPNRRRVVLCSRSGRLKALQSRTPMDIARSRFTLEGLLKAEAPSAGVPLAAIVEAIAAEAVAHHVDLPVREILAPYEGCTSAETVNRRAGDMLEAAIAAASGTGGSNFLVDLFSDAQLELWDGWAQRLLDGDDETRYRREFESDFLGFFAPCPISTARKLLALHRAGRLNVVMGVTAVEFSEEADGYLVHHAFGSEQATALVNTTGGVDRVVSSADQPALVRDLHANGLLRPHRTRRGEASPGAAADMATFRADGARNIYLANMLLWGPGFFTSSAFMMATIIERLLGALFSGPPAAATRQGAPTLPGRWRLRRND